MDKNEVQKSKDFIREKLQIDNSIIDSMNSLTLIGVVRAILSAEYKKNHPNKKWGVICNCSEKKGNHYHYIDIIFKDNDWQIYDK